MCDQERFLIDCRVHMIAGGMMFVTFNIDILQSFTITKKYHCNEVYSGNPARIV